MTGGASAACLADFPENGQTGLEGLSLAIQADQGAACEVANRFRGILLQKVNPSKTVLMQPVNALESDSAVRP